MTFAVTVPEVGVTLPSSVKQADTSVGTLFNAASNVFEGMAQDNAAKAKAAAAQAALDDGRKVGEATQSVSQEVDFNRDVISSTEQDYKEKKGLYAGLNDVERINRLSEQRGFLSEQSRAQISVIRTKLFNDAVASGHDIDGIMSNFDKSTKSFFTAREAIDTEYGVEKEKRERQQKALDKYDEVARTLGFTTSDGEDGPVVNVYIKTEAAKALVVQKTAVDVAKTTQLYNEGGFAGVSGTVLTTGLSAVAEVQALFKTNPEAAAAKAQQLIPYFSNVDAWSSLDRTLKLTGGTDAYAKANRVLGGKLDTDLSEQFKTITKQLQDVSVGKPALDALGNSLSARKARDDTQVYSSLQEKFGINANTVMKASDLTGFGAAQNATILTKMMDGQTDTLTSDDKAKAREFLSDYNAKAPEGQKLNLSTARSTSMFYKSLITGDASLLASYDPSMFVGGSPTDKVGKNLISETNESIKKLESDVNAALGNNNFMTHKSLTEIFTFTKNKDGGLALLPNKDLPKELQEKLSRSTVVKDLSRLIESSAVIHHLAPVDYINDKFGAKAEEAPAPKPETKTSGLDTEGLSEPDLMDIQSYILELKAKAHRESSKAAVA